ncbi:hypothetical protein CCB80_00830 [Armatimonadetes bacterium Uphvl-Ar1]|nr:hypothetical protein CCB80_00830 [Armatimonadetes bacterium Uphvl-Ar1]
MRILVHDYAGHPFTVQLSREFARMGHEVMHVFSANLTSTPQGLNERLPDDPAHFHLRPVDIGRTIRRQSYVKILLKDDPDHGKGVQAAIHEFQPNVVLSGNCSPTVNQFVQSACWELAIPSVYWVQDLYGHSANAILPKKFGAAGSFAAKLVDWHEQWILGKSDGMVVIADAFKPHIRKYSGHIEVIENWGPSLGEGVLPRKNEWAMANGFAETRNLIYSGTIGMKHNPELLVKVAEAFRDESDVRMVVISAGIGMDYLVKRKEELGLENLVLMGFQPFEVVPQIQASADVLVAILEPDAGVFSVPSKVLAYLCAGRSLLLGVPLENLSSRIVDENGAGLVVDPTDEVGFVAAARRLMGDPVMRDEMGVAARGYAERTFDVSGIAGRFLGVFRGVGAK